jgi:hypothetical protein
MPFCPKCRDEFQGWVKVCPDCKIELIDKLLPIPKPVENKVLYEKLVTVASFSRPEEAHVISARLESENIRSCLANEYTVITNWFFSNTVGGVKVQVRESDAAEATRILSLTQPDIQGAASSEETCPNCNSANIQYEIFSVSPVYVTYLITLFIMLIGSSAVPTGILPGGFILPLYKRKWKCTTCGHQWKNRS